MSGYPETLPAVSASRSMNVMASTTMESNPSIKPRLIIRRIAERRKTTYLKGPPFINGEGLILVNRRGREDRRKRPVSGGEVCALLRGRS